MLQALILLARPLEEILLLFKRIMHFGAVPDRAWPLPIRQYKQRVTLILSWFTQTITRTGLRRQFQAFPTTSMAIIRSSAKKRAQMFPHIFIASVTSSPPALEPIKSPSKWPQQFGGWAFQCLNIVD